MNTQVYIKIGLIALICMGVIGFTEQRNDGRLLRDLSVNIHNEVDTNHFISKGDIRRIIEQAGVVPGTTLLEQVDTKKLEKLLSESSFVASCQVSRNISGRLLIDIAENRPVARLLLPGGAGAYLTNEGNVLPLSQRFTARVLILRGRGAERMMSPSYWWSEDAKKILELLSYINNDQFWKAQIAEIDIDFKGNMSFLPTVGDEIIEFGNTDNYPDKFNKLKIYYNEIIPRKGWQFYKKVSVRYDNQIICK